MLQTTGPSECCLLFPGQSVINEACGCYSRVCCRVEFDGRVVSGILEKTTLSADVPFYRASSAKLRQNMIDELHYLIGRLYLFFNLPGKPGAKVRKGKEERKTERWVHEAVNFIEKNYQWDFLWVKLLWTRESAAAALESC